MKEVRRICLTRIRASENSVSTLIAKIKLIAFISQILFSFYYKSLNYKRENSLHQKSSQHSDRINQRAFSSPDFSIFLLSGFIYFKFRLQRGEEVSHPLIDTPDGHGDQRQARLKPGAGLSSESPTGVATAPGLGPSCAAFSGALTGSWIRSRPLGTETRAHVEWQLQRCWQTRIE